MQELYNYAENTLEEISIKKFNTKYENLNDKQVKEVHSIFFTKQLRSIKDNISIIIKTVSRASLIKVVNHGRRAEIICDSSQLLYIT